MLMDGLLIATGFFGALTVVWLVRRVAAFSGPGVRACFGTEAREALSHAIGRARREVLLLGDVDGALAGPLTEAQNRKVALDVVLGLDADPAPFAQANVQARTASKATPPGLLLIVDDRLVVLAASQGQAVVVQGQRAVVAACRQHFAAHHPVGQPAAEPAPSAAPAKAPKPEPAPNYQAPSAPPPPKPAPASQAPAEPPVYQSPATSPVDELLAAVARGTAAPAEEEEEEEAAAPVTRATADLFARLRKEVSAAGRDDSAEKDE